MKHSSPSFDADFEPDGDGIKDAAAARWKAVEAINAHPWLSPAARRVGIALICVMDSRTRACYPSEARLAAQTGMTRRSVVRAKEELRRYSLIYWQTDGGPRHLCRYAFNWAALTKGYEIAKGRADDAMAARRKQRPKRIAKGPRSTVTRDRAVSTQPTSTWDEPVPSDNDENASTRDSAVHHMGQDCLSTRDRAVSSPGTGLSPELSHLTTHVTTQQSTPSQATAALARAEDERTGQKPAHYDAFEGLQSAPSAGKEALERKRHQAPPKLRCHYPSLTLEFQKSNPEIYERICTLDANSQCKVSVTLARKGRAAAVELIHRNERTTA